jgi:hypothetical protein
MKHGSSSFSARQIASKKLQEHLINNTNTQHTTTIQNSNRTTIVNGIAMELCPSDLAPATEQQ